MFIDALAQRYGWRIEEIENLDIEFVAAIQGIMEAEAAKRRKDDLKLRLGSKGK